MHSEIWYAFGGWDLEDEAAVGGGVLLETYPTLAEALAALPEYELLAPAIYGPGALVVLARDGERLAGPCTCPLLVAD